MKSCLIIDSTWADSVTSLRMAEYASSPDFLSVDKAKISWSADDQMAIVLGVCDQDGNLISTMRGRFAWDVNEAERISDCRLPSHVYSWPAMVLERAATSVHYRKVGLNSLLRLHFILLAIRWNVGVMLGAVVRDSARLNVMREIGYQFFPNTLDWPDACPARPTLGAVLNLRQNGTDAVNRLICIVGALAVEFPWKANYPVCPFAA